MRGYLARKQHRPRYRGIAKIHKIHANSLKTVEIANGLKPDSRNVIMQEVNEIDEQIINAIFAIKVNSEPFSHHHFSAPFPNSI